MNRPVVLREQSGRRPRVVERGELLDAIGLPVDGGADDNGVRPGAPKHRDFGELRGMAVAVGFVAVAVIVADERHGPARGDDVRTGGAAHDDARVSPQRVDRLDMAVGGERAARSGLTEETGDDFYTRGT